MIELVHIYVKFQTGHTEEVFSNLSPICFCVHFEFSQILEAFVKDDSLFVKNCRQLMAQNEKVVTMPQYEFRNICDTKLESIDKRIFSYKQVWHLSCYYLFILSYSLVHFFF